MLMLASVPLLADVPIPHAFQAGTPAVAAEVNANFAALQSALEGALSRIDALEAELAKVQANDALALHGHVEVVPDPYVPDGYTIRFSGVNVQIVNGLGQTASINGLGNLIVGYNQPRSFLIDVCSDGQYQDATSCANAGETWANNHKSGSHNIIGGTHNAYSSYGALVVGAQNVVNQRYVSVSGGYANSASGQFSSIAGGYSNEARGYVGSISGGEDNVASGHASSILGGDGNLADAAYQTIP